MPDQQEAKKQEAQQPPPAPIDVQLKHQQEENGKLHVALRQAAEDMQLMREMMERQQKLLLQRPVASGEVVQQPTPEPGTEVIFTNHAGKFEHGIVVSSTEYDGCVLNVTGAHPSDKQQYEFVKIGRKGTRGTYCIPTAGELESTLGPLRDQQKKLKTRMEESSRFSAVVRQKGGQGDVEGRPPAPEFAPVLTH